MATIQDLIDVQLVDATGYVDTDNSDVLGTVFAHYWGPTTSTLRRVTQQQFRQLYPEVVPFVPNSSINHSILEFMTLDAVASYGQILKAFANGIGTAEVKNISNLNRFVIRAELDTEGSGATAITGKWKTDLDIETYLWAVVLKYRGYIPSSLVSSGALTFEWSTNSTTGLTTIKVVNGTTVLEEFTGSFIPNTVVDGQDVYFGTLLANSQFLAVWTKETLTSVTVTDGSVAYDLGSVEGSFNMVDLSNLSVEKSVGKEDMEAFGDIKKSKATLLISPFNYSSDSRVTSLDTKLAAIADSKKTLNFVRGAHTASVLSDYDSGTFPSDAGTKYFGLYVIGRESFKVFGKSITLNCVAGWCGSTAAVAKQVRLNQLASADAFGRYEGTLTWSPDFGYVLDAHKKGIITVYTSDDGPQIFGVRAYLKNQNTYYAKANVMRVLAAILREQLPILMRGIHTDAAANPITRRVLASQMSSVLGEYIGTQDIAPDSWIDMSDELNNDVDTKGGQILLVMGYLHFYKLVEEVKYKIVATDSSVNVELS